MSWRHGILFGILAAAVFAVFLSPPIAQNQAYHNFADQRALFGVPNCLNIISNLPFLIVGLWGMLALLSADGRASVQFLDSRERWPYVVFFLGVALTAFGSSYYHLQPGDTRLVWDRAPMTIGFMGLLSAMIGERTGVKIGLRLLGPLVVLGLGTVFYWRVTQEAGRGDLRDYGLVQFGSMLAILLLIALFPPRYTRGADLIVSFAIYGLAKVFEAADRPVFAAGRIVSGHTLKHIAAAISAYWILRMLQARGPVSQFAAAEGRFGMR